MQYLIFIFVIVVTFPNRCATLCGIICLILYDINYFIIIYITYSWEPKFDLVFDVGKVDVVIFDCCILWYDDKYYVYYTRLYFFMCTSDSLFERLLTFLKLIFFCQICLILAEATAIGIRLSHASRTNLDSWRTAQ